MKSLRDEILGFASGEIKSANNLAKQDLAPRKRDFIHASGFIPPSADLTKNTKSIDLVFFWRAVRGSNS